MIQDLELQPTDIMILIGQAWDKSFNNIDGNKNTIRERGWFPYDRNLLLHKDVRRAMADEEIEKEKEKLYYSSSLFIETIDLSLPTFDPKFKTKQKTNEKRDRNIMNGFSSHVVTAILRENDREWARDKVKLMKSKGDDLKTKLSQMKSISAGHLVKSGEHRLGESLFQEKLRRDNEKKIIEQEANKKADHEYLIKCNKADEVLAKKNDPKTMTIMELKRVLTPLRRKDDPVMPKGKEELVQRYCNWVEKERRMRRIVHQGSE
jgi:hypothetical protein